MDNKLYKEQKHTTYEIQKGLNLTKDYLYKYIRGTVLIEKMPADILFKIAQYENIEANQLYFKMLECQIERVINSEKTKSLRTV